MLMIAVMHNRYNIDKDTVGQLHEQRDDKSTLLRLHYVWTLPYYRSYSDIPRSLLLPELLEKLDY